MSDERCPKCGHNMFELMNSDGFCGWHCSWCSEATLAAATERADKAERERDAAQAAAAAMRAAIGDFLAFENHADTLADYCGQENDWMKQTEALAASIEPNPGQPILDELARLREIERRLKDNTFAQRFSITLEMWKMLRDYRAAVEGKP